MFLFCHFYVCLTIGVVATPFENLHSRLKNPIKYELLSENIMSQNYLTEDIRNSLDVTESSAQLLFITEKKVVSSYLSEKHDPEVVQTPNSDNLLDKTTVVGTKYYEESKWRNTKQTIESFLTNGWIYTKRVIEDTDESEYKEDGQTVLKFLNILALAGDGSSSSENPKTHNGNTEIISTKTLDNFKEKSVEIPIYVLPNISYIPVNYWSLFNTSTQNYVTGSYYESLESSLVNQQFFSNAARKVTIVIFIPKEYDRFRSNELTKYSNENSTKHILNIPKQYQRQVKKLGKCFTCGLNDTGLSETLCYDVFASKYITRSHNHQKNNLKTKCPEREHYKNGCFKRFLDVGNYYYERGCRTWPPTRGMSYASKRLWKVELLLEKKNIGCQFSPMASLTPFSRAISLYVRYHVCVCQGKYCNGGNTIVVKVEAFLAILFVLLLSK